MCLDNGYHGDTLGAVSVGGIDIFHKAFSPLLFKTLRAPSYYCYRCPLGETWPGCGIACADEMGKILRENHEEIAAVILEPCVQAAGGMVVAPDGYLAKVREYCTRYDVLMIVDEVATGFGRTGKDVRVRTRRGNTRHYGSGKGDDRWIPSALGDSYDR